MAKFGEGLWDKLYDDVYEYSYKNGVKWIIGFSGTVAGVLAVFGVVVNFALAGFLAFGIQTLIIIALMADRHKRKQLNNTKSRALNRYTKKITQNQQSNPNLFEILEWDEIVKVSGKTGDAVMTRWITVQNGDEELDALWSKCEKYVHDPKDVNNYTAPTVTAHEFHLEAAQSGTVRRPGPSVSVTHDWENLNEGRQIAFLHFVEPIQPNAVVRICIEWDWPKYFDELLAGNPEPIYWTFHRRVSNFSAKLVLTQSCKVGEPRASGLRGGAAPVISPNSSSDTEVTLNLSEPPTGRRIGYNLEVPRR